MYEWSLSTGKRETECVLKSCSYNCVTISPDGKIIFAVGSDQTLKEIADSSVSLPLSLLWVAALICRRQLPVFTAERGSPRTGPLLLGRIPASSFLDDQLSNCYLWNFLPSAHLTHLSCGALFHSSFAC